MNNYEIVFIVHPEQIEHIPNIITKYQTLITSQGGFIHRSENWGNRQLAYPIRRLFKGNYLCMNIECNNFVLEILNKSFKYNNSILRYMIIKTKNAPKCSSIMMKIFKKKK